MDLLRAGRLGGLNINGNSCEDQLDHENIDEWLDDLEGYISGKVDPELLKRQKRKEKRQRLLIKNRISEPCGRAWKYQY